jgi:hypothetical protein
LEKYNQLAIQESCLLQSLRCAPRCSINCKGLY